MKCPMGTLGCAQLGHFIKVKLYKLEGNKSLVKGYIGKSLIRIDGVTAPENHMKLRPSVTRHVLKNCPRLIHIDIFTIYHQVTLDHGNPPKRQTMFGDYLITYCCVKC